MSRSKYLRLVSESVCVYTINVVRSSRILGMECGKGFGRVTLDRNLYHMEIESPHPLPSTAGAPATVLSVESLEAAVQQLPAGTCWMRIQQVASHYATSG